MRHAHAPIALLFSLGVFAVAGCEVSSEGPRDRPEEAMLPANEVDSIAREVRSRFADWFGSGGQPAATAEALYAPDAIFSDEAETTHSGVAGIREAFAQMQPGATLTYSSLGAVGSGNLITDLGTYTVRFIGPEGRQITADGRYMLALQRMDDGTWKIVRQLSVAGAPVVATPDAMTRPDSALPPDTAARRDRLFAPPASESGFTPAP